MDEANVKIWFNQTVEGVVWRKKSLWTIEVASVMNWTYGALILPRVSRLPRLQRVPKSAQSAQKCPKVLNNAQKVPRLPRLPESAQKCPNLPRDRKDSKTDWVTEWLTDRLTTWPSDHLTEGTNQASDWSESASNNLRWTLGGKGGKGGGRGGGHHKILIFCST